MNEVRFLSVEDVVLIHRDQIEIFGGTPGIRDEALLDSAVFQARASFHGVYLHHDVFQMAAALLFHVVSNHAFLDGNKRTGLAAALVFLDLNGYVLVGSNARIRELTYSVARSELSVMEIAEVLRELATR